MLKKILSDNQKQLLFKIKSKITHTILTRRKKYDLAICCIIKDENEYLDEWINYHQKIGVKIFFIYDNISKKPVEEFLEKNTFRNSIVIETIMGIGVQVKAYKNCLEKYGRFCQWIAFIDVDEFIVPKTTIHLPSFLKNYTSYAGLAVNWKCFGSSGHVTKPKEPQVKSFTYCLDKKSFENSHIKSIVQPQFVKEPAVNPHQFVYKKGEFCVDENFKKVEGPFNKHTSNKIQLNHYMLRSEEEYMKKLERGPGDFVSKRTMKNFEDVNLICNQQDFSIQHLS